MFRSRTREQKSIIRLNALLLVVFFIVLPFAFPAAAQDSQDHDKKLDVRTSAGDLHVGDDADARKVGLPLYPGARPRHGHEDRNSVNLGILMQSFGMKLVVANYDSDDDPGKVIEYYRDKLKKYGKVLECHTREHGGDIRADGDSEDDSAPKPLKCEGDNSGPVTELKVGTEKNQHLVAIEPQEKRTGSTFALVYLHLRGKQGDI